MKKKDDKKEKRIVLFCFSLFLFLVVFSIVNMSVQTFSPEYTQYFAAEQTKREYEKKQNLREFEEAVAGLRPAESLRDPKKTKLVRLVRAIHLWDSPSSGEYMLELSALQRECIVKNTEGKLNCDEKGICQYECLGPEFNLLASDRFGRLVKGDASALTPVATLPAETAKVQMPTLWPSKIGLGVSWLIASFISAAILAFGLFLAGAKWSRRLIIAAWIIFFPGMFIVHVLFRPFKTAKDVRKTWLKFRSQRLVSAIRHDLASLWPKRDPYRDQFALEDLEKLRVLSEDQKTPPRTRIRLAKYIRIEQALQALEPKPQEKSAEATVEPPVDQPAEQQPASQTA